MFISGILFKLILTTVFFFYLSGSFLRLQIKFHGGKTEACHPPKRHATKAALLQNMQNEPHRRTKHPNDVMHQKRAFPTSHLTEKRITGKL